MKVLSGSKKEKVVARRGNYKVLEIIDFKGNRKFYLMTKSGVILRQFTAFDKAHDALIKTQIGKSKIKKEGSVVISKSTYYRKCSNCGYTKDMPKTYGMASGKSITPLVICPKCKTRNFVLGMR